MVEGSEQENKMDNEMKRYERAVARQVAVELVLGAARGLVEQYAVALTGCSVDFAEALRAATMSLDTAVKRATDAADEAKDDLTGMCCGEHAAVTVNGFGWTVRREVEIVSIARRIDGWYSTHISPASHPLYQTPVGDSSRAAAHATSDVVDACIELTAKARAEVAAEVAGK